MSTIRKEFVISAAKELVWAAWTRSDRVTVWLAPQANIDAREGGASELFFDPSNHDHMSTKGCTFTLVEPMTRLGFTWKGPDDFAEVMNLPDSLTSVLVTLHDENGATRLQLEHTGWGVGEAWEKAKAWHEMAWEQVLESLKSALESGEGQLCCAPEENAS